MFKKYTILSLCLLVLFATLTACGKSAGTGQTEATAHMTAEAEVTEKTNEKTKLKVVTTIFPVYDWVKNILGDHLEETDLEMLVDKGIDLHSYQPTAEDIMKIQSCDLFVYVGGESDRWIDDALKGAKNPNLKAVNLLDLLGDRAKLEEVIEGMQDHDHDHDHSHEEADDHDHESGEAHDHDHDSDHSHSHEEGEDHDHEEELDEHVWLSLKNAQFYAEQLSKVLAEIKPEWDKDFQANAESYREKLTDLDKQYQDTVDQAQVKTLLFADRFPFRYLVDDYGLAYYAAFIGCSAETEASFETISFLANKVDELQLKSIICLEKSDQKIAKTVQSTAKQAETQILTMDSMQSVTAQDLSAGTTYLRIMEDNLGVLNQALK